MLSLTDVRVRYGPVVAVHGLTMAIREREIVALLGANGAGKSSTLNAIVSLAPVVAGAIRFDGQEITRRSTEAIVRRGVSLVPEGRHVFANLTVAENLRLGAATLAKSEYAGLLAEVLDLFPVLKDRLATRAGLFSGGQQQMLAIARGLMSRPKLILLDEPSLGLAPIVVASVFELIEKLRDLGTTILLVEQNVERALAVADRAFVLSAGRLELSGDAAGLASQEIERAYLGISTERS